MYTPMMLMLHSYDPNFALELQGSFKSSYELQIAAHELHTSPPIRSSHSTLSLGVEILILDLRLKKIGLDLGLDLNK